MLGAFKITTSFTFLKREGAGGGGHNQILQNYCGALAYCALSQERAHERSSGIKRKQFPVHLLQEDPLQTTARFAYCATKKFKCIKVCPKVKFQITLKKWK